MSVERYGGFWRRAIAFSIDMSILFFISIILLVSGILVFFFGSLSQDIQMLRAEWVGLTLRFILLYWLTIMIVQMLYFTYFHGNTGQTPGKMLLGLQVLQVTGEKLTYGIAFLRWVGYIISKMFLWLGFIWIGFDYKKRGWHDYIAGTIVIQLLREPESIAENTIMPANEMGTSAASG
jgi:uncharacterized RDD family membrane protein YckC